VSSLLEFDRSSVLALIDPSASDLTMASVENGPFSDPPRA
jgi:hypothetical protein